MSRVLTVFFSMTGETYANGGVVKLDKGYTHIAAEYIQQAVGGDIFHIEQIREYSEDHFEMINEAKEEFEKDMRPELKSYADSIDEYDTVFVCYPNWWNTLPMPVLTFIDRYDWSGKTVIPFNTSGGGGFGRSIDALKRHCKGASVSDGLTVKGTNVKSNRDMIMEWAAALI